MTQARQAERSIPQVANFLPAALAVALILGVIAAFGMIAVPRIDFGTQDTRLSPAVVQSGQDWEAQRQQQSGYTDPVIQSGQDWDAQRDQQSYTDPVTQSGEDWEAQRHQQSGLPSR